jgi:putative oxidoreductase
MAKLYALLIRAGEPLQSLILLLFRSYWGWQLFLTGKGKLLNHQNVVSFFTELGIPAPGINAWFVGGLECFGGLLLLLGLCSRPVALLMAGNMTVAYLSVAEDRAKLLSIFSDPEPFLMADPFFFLLMSVLVLAFGPGNFSLDAWIVRRLDGACECRPDVHQSDKVAVNR